MDLLHLLDIFWEAWLTFYNNNMYFMYSMQLHLYKQPLDLVDIVAVAAGCWLCGVCALNIMFLSAGGYFTFSQSKYYCDLNFVATNRPESSQCPPTHHGDGDTVFNCIKCQMENNNLQFFILHRQGRPFFHWQLFLCFLKWATNAILWSKR